MIDWKQKLYAFLLRRALGPLFDASSIQKLHDSIDISLQEGKFVLKNITLDATYLTKHLSDNYPGLKVRSGRIHRLEINLTLKENCLDKDDSTRAQSSLVWRAIKLGSSNESFPVVSLVTESTIDDIFIELETTELKQREPDLSSPSSNRTQRCDNKICVEEAMPRNIIGSYIEAALATLKLNLELTNVHIKFCHHLGSGSHKVWIGVKIASLSYNDRDTNVLDNIESPIQAAVANTVIRFSDILVETGEESQLKISTPFHSVVALAEGSGQIFFRLINVGPPYQDFECTNRQHSSLRRDIEARLNHHLNFSFDNSSFLIVHQIIIGLNDIVEGNIESDQVKFRQSSMVNNPHLESIDRDREDLKALTGIMGQYREAYHMAEQNRIKGGILVPSNAYLDESLRTKEIENETTFDMFFDANDRSLHNASILMENAHLLRDSQKDDDSLDQIHTKLRVSLLRFSIKINFHQHDQNQNNCRAEEYILVTLDDISLSLFSTQQTNEINLIVTYIQAEEAYLNKSNDDKDYHTSFNGAMKIGNILGWQEGDGIERDSALVSEAPCLTCQWKYTSDNKDYRINCNMTLLPLELLFRQQTMANILEFATVTKKGFTGIIGPAPSSHSSMSNLSLENGAEISLLLDCSSISLYLPLVEQSPSLLLFNRCGQNFTSDVIRESSIGVIFENTGFEFKLHRTKNTTRGQENVVGAFLCSHMGFVVAAPKDEGKYETYMLRKDIFIASGREEVNPTEPISFTLRRALPTTGEENLGKKSFPIVPTISSFKARQEDDDKNIRTSSNAFANFSESTSCSRKDLKSSDPQMMMIANSEKSTIIFKADVPEILIDLTTDELEMFLLIVRRIQDLRPRRAEKVRAKTHSSFSDKLSVAFDLGKITISVRDDIKQVEVKEEMMPNRIHSFLFAMDDIKSHIHFCASEMKHFRILCQDLCLYISYRTPPSIQIDPREKVLKRRFRVLKNALETFSKVLVVPIIFRSQLFTPISQETPSILLDFVDLPVPDFSANNSLQRRRLYFTLYHLTYRYDVDSDWIELLTVILLPLTEGQDISKANLTSKKLPQDKNKALMTRIIISFSDVNIDYKSPRYFETASRSIIRIGDLRLSSNIVTPAGLKQSYNFSISDVTYYINSDNIENHYLSENSDLCRSSLIMKIKKHTDERKKSVLGTMPEAILRELNFINIISLDVIDVIVTNRSEEVVSRIHCSKYPICTVYLVVGTLSLHACKDSFTCFVNSIGELNSKLTGLSDKDLEILKGQVSDPVIGSTCRRKKVQTYDDIKYNENRASIQSFKIPTNEGVAQTIPINGHEWTTVDNDLLPELMIPSGDEQTSEWYSTTVSHKFLEKSLPNSQIMHHHFPFHSTSDSLPEGDMGARTLSGGSRDLFLKSRISIEKLNVKMRLFDGFDWPGKCSTIQKKAVTMAAKNFVIEPLSEFNPEKKKREDMLEDRHTFTAKARLMDELLIPQDNDIEAFFEEVPIPEVKASTINHEKYLRMSKRRSNVFCQVSFNGIILRMDSYQQSKSHRLQSVLEVSVSNLFVAETISDCKPIKMIGDWKNDYDHPRDTRFGTLMFSMATWAPVRKIIQDNEIASDECNVTVQLLPMRCLLDQRAISFIESFFFKHEGINISAKNEKKNWASKVHLPPPPTFKSFKIKPWKIKVDYYPTRIDISALREGSIVELINLSPIQRMVITLDEVIVLNSSGLIPVFGEAVSNWIKEICATQLHKFLANAHPFEPFTDVGKGLTDLVILPYEAFKQGDSVQRAMKEGVKSLAETVVFQTLATTSGLTKVLAGAMANSLGAKGGNDASDPLPSRPLSFPTGIGDARLHAARSLTRGLNAANHKIVVVPYREYLRNGVPGALTSVIKGVPVLLVAPLIGATEATSFTLLGAQNALRPDLCKEEEASILD